MTLHTDLLTQARFLARKEPKKPSQASLRRAVSAAYYALFHLLVDEATKLMFPGRPRGPLRRVVSRAFRHTTMRSVARQFATPGPPARLDRAIPAEPIEPALVDLAKAFEELQQARHEADYDLARPFTRSEVLLLIDLSERAFRNWRTVRRTPQADAFLAGLLAYDNIHVSRR